MSEWVRRGKRRRGVGVEGKAAFSEEKGPQIQKAEEWQAPEWDLLGETRRREMGKMAGAWRRRMSRIGREFSLRYFVACMEGRLSLRRAAQPLLTVRSGTLKTPLLGTAGSGAPSVWASWLKATSVDTNQGASQNCAHTLKHLHTRCTNLHTINWLFNFCSTQEEFDRLEQERVDLTSWWISFKLLFWLIYFLSEYICRSQKVCQKEVATLTFKISYMMVCVEMFPAV